MRIMHVALGGCLKAPPVSYGITEDTGGHIAYVLGAALAQAALASVDDVEIVTRRFEDHALGDEYAREGERIAGGPRITRLSTERTAYLSKEDLIGELPALGRALIAHVGAMKRRPDVVHAHFADAAEIALPLRRAFGIPVIYTAHSLAIDKRDVCGARGLRTRILREKNAISRADAIIASRRDEAERQLMLYPGAEAGRIHRIVPGVDPIPDDIDTSAAQALVAPFLRDAARPPVLAIARPVEKKNLAGLVDIFAASGLADRANLVIVAGRRDGVDEGDAETLGVHRAILAAIDRHDLYGRVAYPRTHGPGDVAALYRLAERLGGVFVNPAFTEPYGLTLLEAGAAGLPVVATSHGGPSDIVGQIGHGAVADPRDLAAFGAAIARLIDDRGAWAEAASNARARTAPSCSWTRYAQRSVAVARALTPRRAEAAARPALLMSDIDNTLTGSAEGARRFAEWNARQDTHVFAIATGRSLTEARRVLSDWDLPEPDIFVTSVGTEIYMRGKDGRVVKDPSWSRHVDHDWHPRALRDAMGRIGLRPQHEIEFREHKLSYIGPAADAEAAREAADEAGLPARVIHSHDELIDVVPARAGKGAALRWVAAALGVPLSCCVAAGDSGNDLDLFERAPRAIAVANHSAELGPVLSRPGIYVARAAHADGVLEGLSAA